METDKIIDLATATILDIIPIISNTGESDFDINAMSKGDK